jgi:hypothetical protein
MYCVSLAQKFGRVPPFPAGPLNVSLYDENDQRSRPLGTVTYCDQDGNPLPADQAQTGLAVVAHWGANPYTQVANGYHVNAAFCKSSMQPVIVRTLEWGELGKHAWMRNTGHVGMAFSAGAGLSWAQDRTIINPGIAPITAPHIEGMAVTIAEICAWKHIDPRGYHLGPEYRREGEHLIATGGTLVLPNLLDHKDLAELDGYQADRGDIGPYKDPLFTRATELYDGLKAGHATFQLLSILK